MLKGTHHSEESKIKIGKIHIGIKPSNETLQKRSEALKGRIFSDEHKKKLSEANKGKQHTEEAKRKMSEAKKGNKYTLGKKRSEESKKRISEAGKGKHFGFHHSEETKRTISKAKKGNKNMIGKHHSEETKRKISEAHIGKYTGENSPSWQGGKSFEPYSIDWTETLRRSIRERDNYICQLCNRIQGDKAHSIHHINYDKKNNNPQNLITLCINCHSKTNTNREYWENILIKKINRGNVESQKSN